MLASFGQALSLRVYVTGNAISFKCTCEHKAKFTATTFGKSLFILFCLDSLSREDSIADISERAIC